MIKSKIDWCDSTWNFLIGCFKVSQGCLNSYAEKLSYRIAAAGHSLYKKVMNGKKWNGIVQVNMKVLSEAKVLKQRNKSDILHQTFKKRIFINSLSDTFYKSVDHKIIDLMFYKTLQYNHQYFILTKRPDLMYLYFENMNKSQLFNIANGDYYFGVSVEDKDAVSRIEVLYYLKKNFKLKTFISFEPLIDNISLELLRMFKKVPGSPDYYPDWAVIGAESGKLKRYCDPIYIQSLIGILNTCKIPLFVKQVHSERFAGVSKFSLLKGHNIPGYLDYKDLPPFLNLKPKNL